MPNIGVRVCCWCWETRGRFRAQTESALAVGTAIPKVVDLLSRVTGTPRVQPGAAVGGGTSSSAGGPPVPGVKKVSF